MTGLREREEGRRNGEVLFGGITDKINALAFIPFHHNESVGPSIVSFLSSCVSRSGGCARSGGLCAVKKGSAKEE